MATVIALALILRLLFVLSDHGNVIPPDGELYSSIAIHVLEGDGYIQDARSYSIVVPPAYPTFLAFVYAVMGAENSRAILMVQVVLSLFTVLIVYFIGSDIAGSVAGIIGAFLFSIHWVSIYFVGFVLTETMFTLFTALLTWIFLRSLDSPNKLRLSMLLGVVWGVGILCRPHFLFFIPLGFVVFGVMKGRIGIRSIGVTAIVVLLVISPWIAYISIQQGRLIPVASYGGLSLWIGNSNFTNPSTYYHSQLYAENPEFLSIKADAEMLEGSAQDAFYREKVMQFITQAPLRFLSNTWRKWLLFWKPVASPLNIRATLGRVISYRIDQLLVALGAIGAFILLALRRSRQAAILLCAILVYYSGFASLSNIVSAGRYRLPIMPVMAAIVGAAIVLVVRSLFKLWQKRRTANT